MQAESYCSKKGKLAFFDSRNQYDVLIDGIREGNFFEKYIF